MTRVLVVEDETIIAMDIEATLARIGHEVLATASTGDEAVRLADELCPDLVLMDIRLMDGSMAGLAAASRIRTRHSVPVIFLSAYAGEPALSNLTETSRGGVVGLLTKPFDARQLKAAIEGVLH